MSCIFWPVFGCCALQMLVKICFFKVFWAKHWKKGRKSKKFEAKVSTKMGFLSLHPNTGWGFYISTREQRAKHPYAGLNTQQICLFRSIWPLFPLPVLEWRHLWRVSLVLFSFAGLLKTMTELFSNISSIRWQDTTLGIASIIFLLILKVSAHKRVQTHKK